MEVLLAQSSAAHWEPDLLLPCGLTGTSVFWTERENSISFLGLRPQCKLSAYWKESMPKRSIINSSGKFFSRSLQLPQNLSHNKIQSCNRSGFSKGLPKKLKSMKLRLLKIKFLARWKSVSTKLVTWDEDDGARNGNKTKMLQREVTACELWHSACQHGWPALEPAPMRGTAGTGRIWSEGLYYL